MRKNLTVIVLMFCAAATCVFAQTKATTPQYDTTTAVQPKTTNTWYGGGQPAQAQTQTIYTYGMPFHRLTVQNTAPYSCRLITIAPVGKFGRSATPEAIADLAPGETVFAGKTKKNGFNLFALPSLVGYNRSSELNIPLVCLYFDETSGTKQYVGAAGGIFWVPGAGNSSVSTLTFNLQNIRLANDVSTNAPTAASHLGEKPVEIPYFGTEGTAIQVFVWNSTTPAHITVNGEDSDTLQLGNVKAFIGRAPIVVVVSVVDTNGTVRTWSQSFQNSDYYGTHAQIFILGMRDLR